MDATPMASSHANGQTTPSSNRMTPNQQSPDTDLLNTTQYLEDFI